MPISLLKGNRSINNFFSAVSDLKETNLTAYVAYLLSVFSKYLGKLFLNKGEIIEKIDIEKITENKDRYDIVLNTNQKIIIIEAKLGFQQSERQVSRYIKHLIKYRRKKAVLFLLDDGSYKASSWIGEVESKLPKKLDIKFITWSVIHKNICELLKHKRAKSINAAAYYIAKELKEYMEANNMSSLKRKEIYVRDLSGDSIELFFKYKIYKSQTKFYNSAQGSLYFAPYFTGRAPQDFAERSMIRIEKGISWIAPILDIQNLKRNEIVNYLKTKGHPRYKEAAKEIFKETPSKELMILLLNDPLLAFLTPISKKKLGLYGPMGSRSFTFQDFFQATAKGDRHG